MRIWILTVIGAMALTTLGCQTEGGSKEVNGGKETIAKLDCEPLPDQVGALHFCKLEHDWGTITTGDSVFAFFTFKNVRKFPVRITKVYTSCECTVGDFPVDPIPPGAFGQVIGKFFSAGQPIARFEKILAVEVEGENYPFNLMMKGNVVQ